MSLGQGINIKLFSGQTPWHEQFYSSTCDQMYIGGQHGGAGKTNCPYVNHKDWGTQVGTNDSVYNLQHGMIDKDFFNKWYKTRPYDLRQTGADVLKAYDEGKYDTGLAAPGVAKTYWNNKTATFDSWADKGNEYLAGGYDQKYGANGWDWALQSCRQEYGSYLNSDVKCDDPVCQMEKVAQTNPVYFESGCNTELHHSCVSDEIAKAVLVPIGEAVAAVAIGALTGGAGDAALAGADAAAAAGEAIGEDLGASAVEAAAQKGEEDAVEMTERNIERELQKEGEGAAEDAPPKEGKGGDDEAGDDDGDDPMDEDDSDPNVKRNACRNYKSGGLARSAAITKNRVGLLSRAKAFGRDTSYLAKIKRAEGKMAKARAAAGLAEKGRGVAATTSAMTKVGGLAGAVAVTSANYGITSLYDYTHHKANSGFVLDPGGEFKAGKGLVKGAESVYNDEFDDGYSKCQKQYAKGQVTQREQESIDVLCREQATQKAAEEMHNNISSYDAGQTIAADAQLASNYKKIQRAFAAKKALNDLKAVGRKGFNAAKEEGENPFIKDLGGVGKDGKRDVGGATKQMLRCNKLSTAANVAMITGAGALADSVAHEDCYTCSGNVVQEDSSVADNPFASGLGIQPEKPYTDPSKSNGSVFPRWNADIVKPYCFIPNRRGASDYCPIFGDTLKYEKQDPNWSTNESTEYQKYKGAILGTTDFEVPESRPFWTLNDLQSRIQTGKQGLHHNIEGDTDPQFWGQIGGLWPAFQDQPAEVSSTQGGRMWTNYGYVCNYNHTDDFIMNPIQAQNFLDMTVGPIDTASILQGGTANNTCAVPLLLKDLKDGVTTPGQPETVYSRTGCMTAPQDGNFGGTTLSAPTSFSDLTVEDKIKYYFANDNETRLNVLGQGMANQYYRANIIPVPSDPNIPYNQNFQYLDPGSKDNTALLPDPDPQFTGSMPWFAKGKNSYNYTQYQQDFDANTASYKLPATFWYEHETFNKIMADYCIRKGPRYQYPDGEKIPSEEAYVASHCKLVGGVASDGSPATSNKSPSNKNAIRQYCPNIFVGSAGGFAGTSPSDMTLKSFCYNCSDAELEASLPEIPAPEAVCSRWYKGMVDSYKNLSRITKQNPTQIFKEYHNAVDEYCNDPRHRDLEECACHNADNVNNPTTYNSYFDTWSSFENTNMGTKGMKYCWLTPCVPESGEFTSLANESVKSFKDPAAYADHYMQDPTSPWVGKCPEMACQEFLIYTDNTNLTDTHINDGIKACGGDTLSNEGFICNPDTGECEASGRYISNTDSEYSQTKATCKKKCQKRGPSAPPCLQQYWICKDGKLEKTYDQEYSQFWSGHEASPGSCNKYKPKTASPGNSPGIIDVTSPTAFKKYSDTCTIGSYTPDRDTDDEEEDKKLIIIIIAIITSLLLIVLSYLFLIKPNLKKKNKKNTHINTSHKLVTK